MENEKTKHQTPEQTSNNPSPKEGSHTVDSLALELETLKAEIQKRKSETTTVKIVFYTSLAALLFGFIYTSQILQKAQYRNLESNIGLLHSQINHTLLMLEANLHDKIQDLDLKMGTSGIGFHQTIHSMNQTLDQLEPRTTSIGILIKKVQKSSKELSQMVQDLRSPREITPIP